MKINRWWIVGVVVFLLAAVAFLSGGAPQSPAVADSVLEPIVHRVEVAAVETAVGTRTVTLSGVTRATHRARLSFALGGRLTARAVNVGDRVRAGQVVARIDSQPLSNAVATASAGLAEIEANLAQALREQVRVRRLAAARAATAEEVERTGALVERLTSSRQAAAALLAEARRREGEAVLRAAASGVVSEVFLQPGEYARPGASVIAMAYDGPVELEVEVPESLLAALVVGREVTVNLPLVARSVGAVVVSIATASGRRGGLFPVRVRLDEEGGGPLLPGMTARLEISMTLDDGSAVPVAAVINPGGARPTLFKLVGDRVEQVELELGALVGDRVRVRTAVGALGAEDRVVVAGQTRLVDGAAVEVVQ